MIYQKIEYCEKWHYYCELNSIDVRQHVRIRIRRNGFVELYTPQGIAIVAVLHSWDIKDFERVK